MPLSQTNNTGGAREEARVREVQAFVLVPPEGRHRLVPAVRPEGGHPQVSESTLAPITPQALTHLGHFKAESAAIVARIEGMAIKTDEDERALHQQLQDLKRIQRHAEMVREEQVRPLNAQVKQINDAFRPYTQGFERIEKAAKAKALTYNPAKREAAARAEREQREALERAQRERDELTAKAARARKDETRQAALDAAEEAQARVGAASVALATVEQPSTTVRTDRGTSSVRLVRKFQVVDPSLVPADYKLVDEQRIGREVRAGVLKHLPGVSIWEQEDLQVRV
jgi:hypothetical protein